MTGKDDFICTSIPLSYKKSHRYFKRFHGTSNWYSSWLIYINCSAVTST